MLIALVVLAIGLADIVNAGLSRATGVEFSYGRQRGGLRHSSGRTCGTRRGGQVT